MHFYQLKNQFFLGYNIFGKSFFFTHQHIHDFNLQRRTCFDNLIIKNQEKSFTLNCRDKMGQVCDDRYAKIITLGCQDGSRRS